MNKLAAIAGVGAALSLLPRPVHAAARFLALGDSYTVGTAVTPAQRWPNELVRLMRQEKIDVADPEVIARNGWTTGDLLAGIERAQPKGPYDLVTLMIGVNNQFRGGSVDAYRQDLRKLFAIATRLAGNDARHIVVLTIPDYSVMPYAKDMDTDKIAKDITRFNLVLGEEAHRAGARIVDVTAVSRFAGRNPTLVGDDGLHPSWRLHAVWARLVFPMARPLVSKLH